MYSGVLFQCGFLFPFLPSCFNCDVSFRPGACLSRPGPVCGPGLHNNLRPLGRTDLLLRVQLQHSQDSIFVGRFLSVRPSPMHKIHWKGHVPNFAQGFWTGSLLCLIVCFMVEAVIPCTNSLVILNQLLRVARQSLRSVAESLALRPRPVRHRTRCAGGGDLFSDV